MTNITHEIWSFIEKDPAIRKVFALELTNNRALADHIRKKMELDISLDAVISALRRYPKEKIKLPKDTADKVFKNSKISTKTRMVSVRTYRDPQLLSQILPKIFSAIDASKGEVIRLVEGRESLKILVDKKNLDKLIAVLPKVETEIEDKILTEINIHFAKGYETVTGLRASILNELALNNIDVVETISCLPEFMLFVNEKDTASAHEILLKFMYNA